MDTVESKVNQVIQDLKESLDSQEYRDTVAKVVTQVYMEYQDIADCPDTVVWKVSQDIVEYLVIQVFQGIRGKPVHPDIQESWDYLGTLALPDIRVYRDIQVNQDQVDTAELVAKVVTQELKERLDSQAFQDILVKTASRVIRDTQEVQVTADSMVLMENPDTREFLDFTDLVDIRVSLDTREREE